MGSSLIPPVYPSPPAHRDPDFLRAADWIQTATGADAIVKLLGVPFSELSISGARCDLAPAAVRAALWSFSTYLPERGLDLADYRVTDLGDVALTGLYATEAMKRIEEAVSRAGGGRPVAILGGDNSITAPAMIGAVGVEGGLLTVDAHHDLRDYERDGLSNGSPVRVLLDMGVAGSRIQQIGIRDLANSRIYSDLARREGIGIVTASQVRTRGMAACVEHGLSKLSGTDGVYIDVDLDVVDRASAPGAPGAQPGGLMSSDVMEAAFICGASPMVMALDIVEVDPQRDVAETTARLAAAVLLSFLAGVACR